VAIAEEADHIADVTIEPLSEMKNQVYTVTVDNSNEFAQHKRVAKVYFSHPYGAWERGRNENPHGLLRPYFPKGTGVKRVTQAKIRPAKNRLNDRPRKSLEFRVPNDIFQHGKP
jgi:IS30 family transposase